MKNSLFKSRPYWKTFFPFIVFMVLFQFAGALHYTLMSPFGEKVLPLWAVGLLIGIIGVVQMALDIPAGYILDRFGYKKLLKFACVMFFCAALVFFIGPTVLSFGLTLLLGAFGWLFFGPGTNAYTLIEAPKKMVGKFVASREVFTSLGVVLSSVAMIYVVRFESRLTGLILCLIFFLAFLGIHFSPDEKPHPFKPHPKARRYRLTTSFLREAYHSIAAVRPASFILISSSFVSAVFYALIWFVVPLLLVQAESPGSLGLGLGVFDFSVVILGFVLGKIVDSFNKKALIAVGLIIFASAGILLGFNFGALFILLGFIAASGDELTGLSLWAWLYEIDKEKKHYGVLSSVISMFEDIGWAVGPIIAGVLYSLIGPAYTIAAGGFLILLNLFVYYLLIHPFSPASRKLVSPPHSIVRRKHK